jgi:hypothetical protein
MAIAALPGCALRDTLNSGRVPSRHLQIFRALFVLVRHDIIGDLGAFAQIAQARPLDGRDMDEHVLPATAIGLDETVTLGRIEPLFRLACCPSPQGAKVRGLIVRRPDAPRCKEELNRQGPSNLKG